MLSGFGLSRGGEVTHLELGAQRLIAFLALYSRPLRRRLVSGSLWIDRPEGKANARLRTALWRLRRTGCAVVGVTQNRLPLAAALAADTREIPTRAQRVLADEPGLGDLPASCLTEDLLLHRYDDWVLSQRDRLRQLRRDALESLCVAHAAGRRVAEATEAVLPPRLRPGASLANGRGVPGMLGAFAVRCHDGAPVLLTNHHVLFGGGAAAGEPVWLTPTLRRLGSSLYGKLGSVTHDGLMHHVDCAVASIDAGVGDWRIDEQAPPGVRPGAAVMLDREGRSAHGIVVDVRDFDGAPRQILVRSLAEGEPFSAEGDSGALLRDEGGRAVGFVWGATPAGETIASPLAPVLDVLGIRLLRSRA